MSNDVEKWVSIERDGQGFVALSAPGHDLTPIGPMPIGEARALVVVINARESALLRGAAHAEIVVKFAPSSPHGGVVAAARELVNIINSGTAGAGVQLNRLAIPAGA